MAVRDRIKELRRVKASKIEAHPQNWRTHPDSQRKAMQGVLEEIGWADALLATETADGKYRLVDGHLRADIAGDEEVPILVLDLDEDEARKLLVTLDPLAAMAEVDGEALKELLAEIETKNEAVQAMLDNLAKEIEPPKPPDEFSEYGENIETQYTCPKCQYSWSGSPNPGD